MLAGYMAQKSRHVVKYRRKKLPNGRYLQIAVTDEPGPRGGHTVAYIQTRKGEKVYPGKVIEAPRASSTAGKKSAKHGRRIRVRRKPT